MNSQVVIITGAASGIGAATALCFAKQNAAVCITDVNEQDLRKTSIQCGEVSKNKVLEVVADLTKDEDRDNIVKCALKEFGKIDALVNCAGIYEGAHLQDLSILDKFDRIIAINLRSVIGLSNKVLPALIESKGCIINIASPSSCVFAEDGLVYFITKAGVITFTQCAAFQLASLEVRVNCISPGPVKTKINKNAGISEEEDNKIWNTLADMVPLKKCLKGEEIGEMAVYLASDKAGNITGSDFVVDAGMKLGPVFISKHNSPLL